MSVLLYVSVCLTSRARAQHEWALCQLRVLDCRHRVGEARPRRDDRNARHSCQSRDGISCEHGGGLIAHVNHADAQRLTAHQDRCDVTTREREGEAHALLLQSSSSKQTSVLQVGIGPGQPTGRSECSVHLLGRLLGSQLRHQRIHAAVRRFSHGG